MDFRIIGGAIQEKNIRAFFDKHLNPRHGFINAGGRAAIGARQNQDAGFLRRFNSRADFHARFCAWQAGLAGSGQGAWRDLVFNQDRRCTGAAISAHRALHIHRIAIAVIAIGQHQRIRRRTAHHVETVKHFGEGNQVQIRPAQAACGHAGTGQEGGFKPCAGRHLGG